MAYEEIIANLEAAEGQSGTDLVDFVALINKYAAMGLIIQVHSHELQGVVHHSLVLIYRVSSSVEIRKTVKDDGKAYPWTVFDLTDINA